MTSPAEAAKSTAELGRKHIVDQRFRIERQRKLIAELKRDAHRDFVAKAGQTLREMEKVLAQMEADYAGAQVDQPSPSEVERDALM
jgi:predicted kinase